MVQARTNLRGSGTAAPHRPYAKRKRGRPATGIRRPVIAMRIHEDVYEEIKQAAARNKRKISEEVARRVGLTLIWDKNNLELEEMRRQGVERILQAEGYTKVRDIDGELWAKGDPLTEKFVAINPMMKRIMQEVADIAVERTMQKMKQS